MTASIDFDLLRTCRQTIIDESRWLVDELNNLEYREGDDEHPRLPEGRELISTLNGFARILLDSLIIRLVAAVGKNADEAGGAIKGSSDLVEIADCITDGLAEVALPVGKFIGEVRWDKRDGLLARLILPPMNDVMRAIYAISDELADALDLEEASSPRTE